MKNKLSEIFNRAKKIAVGVAKGVQSVSSPVSAMANAAKFAWKNDGEINKKVLDNPIVKEMTAGTQAFGRNLGDALIAPFVADERNRIQKLNIDSQNKILELAKISKDNGNMQEYNRLMGLYKNDNRVGEFAKETQKQQADWEKQKKAIPKNAAMTGLEIASLTNFLKGGGKNAIKNVGRSTLFSGGLDALGQGIDVATGKQDGYDFKRGGEAVMRGIGNAPLFSLTSKGTDKLLLGVGKKTPLKGALKFTDDALAKSGQEAIKGNWKNVAKYLAKNMTREGLLESFPETAAFYLKDQAKGDERDVFTYFAQELPQNVISGALSTGLGMGGMNVASGKYMPKIRGKIGEALEKAVLPEEFYKMKKLTYESDPNQLTSGIDPSKISIKNILDKKQFPKTPQEGDAQLLADIERKLTLATADAGEAGNLEATKSLLNNIKTNYSNASDEQKAVMYPALQDAFKAAEGTNGKFYFKNFIDAVNKNANQLVTTNPYKSQDSERLDSLAQGDSEMEAKAKREQGIVEPQKSENEKTYNHFTSEESARELLSGKPFDYGKKPIHGAGSKLNTPATQPILAQKTEVKQEVKEEDEQKTKESDVERLEYLKSKLSSLRYKENLATSEKAIEKLGEEINLVKEEISSLESKVEPKAGKEEALGIILVDDKGNEYLPIKENGETSSGASRYTVIDKNGNVTVRDTKNPNYAIDPEGLKVVRDYDSLGKTIEERQKEFIVKGEETKPEVKQEVTKEPVEQNYQDSSAKSELNTEQAKVEAEQLQAINEKILKINAKPVKQDVTPAQKIETNQEVKPEVTNKNEIEPESVSVRIFKGIENKIRKILPKDIDEKSWFEAVERGEEPKGSEKIKHLLSEARRELIENFGFDIGERGNFLPHMKPETIDNIIKNGFHVDGFGQRLAEPTFAKRRTGKLIDYEKSPRAIAAYLAQTKYYMQMTQAEKADLKLSNTLAQQYTNEKPKDTSKDTKGGKKTLLGRIFNKFQKGKESLKSDIKEYAKSQKYFNDDVDFVGEVQKSSPKEFAYDKDGNIIGESAVIKKDLKFNTKKKSKLRSILSASIRSSLDLAENMGDDFYNAFAKDFENQNRQTVKNAIILDKMSKEQLVEYAKSNTDLKNPESQNIEDLKVNIFAKLYNQGKAEVINNFKKTVERTDFGDNIDQKEIVNRLASEFIGDDLKAETFFDQISSNVRKATGRATIGLNILSGVSNIWETKRVWSLTSTAAMTDAIKRVASGENFTEKYGIDSIHSTALVTKNQGTNIYKGAYAKMENDRSKTGNLLNKLDPVLYKVFQTTEGFKDNLFLGAFEYQGRKKGLSGDKLEEFVIRKFNRYAVKYGKGLDTGLYRSNIIKTLFQFGQYPLKDLVILGDKVAGAAKGDMGDLAYTVKYAVSSAIQYMVMRKILGIGRKEDTDTPIDLIKNITKGELPTSPIVNLVGLAAYWGYKEMSGEELSEYEEILKKNQLGNSLLSTFMPAGVQGKKTLEGIFQQARGYDLKSHGRSVANVTGEGIGNTARAVIFGKSYDSGRRDYLENIRKLEKSGQTSKAGLNEKESASFRRVLDSEGIDSAKKFYDNTLQTNMAGVEKSQEMKNIMSGSGKAETDILGNEVEKRSFMQKIGDKFSKKEPVAGEYLQDIDINQLESTTVKSIRQNITKKEELGQEISDKEYEVRYLYDYNKMESDTNSQKIKKDREAFKIAKSMDDNDIMSDEQKEHILTKLEINKDELEYYQMAGEHDDVQSEYIRENILSLGSEEEVMEYLISQRAKVGGEQVLTDTIIGKLVEEGLLDKQTGKNLKAITFVKDNDYDGDDYIMIGDSKYKPVVRKSTSSGSGSSAKSRASTSHKAQAQAWGSIRDILAKQKSINNQGIQNKAVTNQYTRRSLGNSLRQVNPDNQETRLLSQILQQTRQKREAGRPKNNILM